MVSPERPRPTPVDLIKKQMLYHVLDPSADVEKILGYSVPVTQIPRRHLFGIQTVEEYERVKRKSITASTEQDENYLDTHPILVCAVPITHRSPQDFAEIISLEKYQLTLIDGHHRTRFAPRGTKTMNGRIVTINEGVTVLNNKGMKLSEQHKHLDGSDEEIYYHLLKAWTSETLRSFVEHRGRPDLEPYVSVLDRSLDGSIMIS